MSDVVVAPATPRGRAALAVVRLTGSGLDEVLAGFLEPVSPGPLPTGRQRRVRLRDEDGVFDDGVVVVGRAPTTYTGEDTAEITCHGSPLVVDRLVDAAVGSGARMALPGEFTRRAVLHGKLDLLEAEAVDQVSRARTVAGLSLARSGADGAISAFVREVRERLVQGAAELEARLDYPADELAYVEDEALLDGVSGVVSRCRSLASTFAAGRVLVEGARVALVGTVNAGKSSLFNALLGRSRALVHDTPGTTRDVLEVVTELGGVAITLLDTAGERPTTDPIEAAGLALARDLVEEADLLVVVLRARPGGPDASERAILERTAHRPRIVVYNGIDAPDAAPGPADAVPTVATAGRGVEDLRRRLVDELVDAPTRTGQLAIASQRQRDLLLAVARAAEEGVEALPVAGVAVAAEAWTRAIGHVDDLTGADTREDILDALFARFCIGK